MTTFLLSLAAVVIEDYLEHVMPHDYDAEDHVLAAAAKVLHERARFEEGLDEVA